MFACLLACMPACLPTMCCCPPAPPPCAPAPCCLYLQTSTFPATEDELANLQAMGGQLVQLTPDMIKELGSDQIYKIYQM